MVNNAFGAGASMAGPGGYSIASAAVPKIGLP